MAVGDVYHMTFVFTHAPSGEVMNYSLDAQMIVQGTVTDEALICTNLASDAFAKTNVNYIPLLSTEIATDRVECFNRDQPQFAGNSVQAGQVGQQPGDLAPRRSAPVVRKLTGLRGRSFRGRMYMMPVTEPQQAGGALDLPFEVALQGYVNELENFTLTDGSSFQAVVFSETRANAGLSDRFIITQFVVTSVLGTQRSRQATSG